MNAQKYPDFMNTKKQQQKYIKKKEKKQFSMFSDFVYILILPQFFPTYTNWMNHFSNTHSSIQPSFKQKNTLYTISFKYTFTKNMFNEINLGEKNCFCTLFFSPFLFRTHNITYYIYNFLSYSPSFLYSFLPILTFAYTLHFSSNFFWWLLFACQCNFQYTFKLTYSHRQRYVYLPHWIKICLMDF